MKHNISLKGMKPLEEGEFKKYIVGIKNILDYPLSERFFSELHESSLKLIKEKGRNRLSFMLKSFYNFGDSEKEIRLHVFYEKHLLHDKLEIMLYDSGKTTDIVMRRLRLHNAKEKIFDYKPCALGIREDEVQQIISY